MENEVWKDVKGYEGLYRVSNMGQVKSLTRTRKNHSKIQVVPGKILTQSVASNGYFTVSFCAGTVQKTICVHRIVAEAFIPNPDGKRTVNHKNGVKTDNRVENLEWATYSENLTHAHHFGLNKVFTRPVLQYSKHGKFIAEHESISKAARSINKRHGCILRCCRGFRPTAYGYIWRYKQTDEEK